MAPIQTVVRGFPVIVDNTRPDVDTARVLHRLDAALGLIEQHVPHYYRHLKRDFAGILVVRYACRGAYFYDTGQCMVELTFLGTSAHSDAQVAATILHEGMHARLHRLGFPMDLDDRARQERFCRRAEIEFGRLVPGGEAIVERALSTLAMGDQEVAPVIDERLARRRIAEVDARALGRPGPTAE